MMNCDRFFRVKIRQPTKPKAQRAALLSWFFQVLMRTLQSCDRKARRRNCSGFTSPVPLAGAIAMKCDEQRRRSSVRYDYVVIKFEFGCKCALFRGRRYAFINLVHSGLAYNTRTRCPTNFKFVVHLLRTRQFRQTSVCRTDYFAFNFIESYDAAHTGKQACKSKRGNNDEISGWAQYPGDDETSAADAG